MKKLRSLLICCFLVTGCIPSSVQLLAHTAKKIIPWGESNTKYGQYKVGNPYSINGTKYYPREDWDYEEKGIASWYGGSDDNFHGKKTANGEIYNSRDLTAAHRTLPMPSFVKVTNLENGRSLVLRINDRGPYAKGRIIDVSKKAATLLGFKSKGTAKVKVKILKEESMEIAKAAKSGEKLSKVKFSQDVKVEEGSKITASSVTHLPVNKTNIYVQAGSFTIYDNAINLKSKLSDLGPVIIEPAKVNGKDFFRVQMGPIYSVEQADDLLYLLSKMGLEKSNIVVK